MRSSTQAGFSRSPTCSDSGRAFRAWVSADALPLRLSLAVAVAVAHSCRSCTAVASPSPLSGEAPLRLWLPVTVGVGHSWRTATPRGVPDFGSLSFCSRQVSGSEPLRWSPAEGVGHSFTAVRRLGLPSELAA